MKDIQLTWSFSEERDDIFYKVADTIKVDKPLVESNTLNHDVLFYVKKTSLTHIIDDIFSVIKFNGDITNNLKDLVACVLLCSVSPVSSDYLRSPDNQFRDIFAKFKESRGEWMIEKKNIETDDEKEIIELLKRHKLLVESEDSYHVIGYVLRNLQIDFN